MKTTHHRFRLVLLAALAFLLAFGGGASAAKLVTGKQVKDGAVKSVDLRDGSISGADLGGQSLTSDDFAELIQGPRGPDGPPGSAGGQGPTGPGGNGSLAYIIEPKVVPKGDVALWTAPCSSGTKVLGGGVSSTAPQSTRVITSAPDIDGKGWGVEVKNEGSTAFTGFAWAICSPTS